MNCFKISGIRFKGIAFIIALLLTHQLMVGQEMYNFNMGLKTDYSSFSIRPLNHGFNNLIHKHIDISPVQPRGLDLWGYKGSLSPIDLEKKLSLNGYIMTEQSFFDRTTAPRLHSWGSLSYAASPHLLTQIEGLYQSFSNDRYRYALMGSIRYETNDGWSLGGKIRFDQTKGLGGGTYRGLSFHPSLEYAINDRFSIYSCMHISYSHLEGSTHFSNTSLIKYKLSRSTSLFVGTETYFNPRTRRVVVNPTAGIESGVR